MKNQNVFIFPGTGATEKDSWIPWLKQELEERGYSVYVPTLPHPKTFFVKAVLKRLFPGIKNQTYKDCLQVLEKYYKDKINKDSIFVGHSLGGLFLLKVLENLEKPVAKAIFVAAAVGVRPIKYYNNDYDFIGGFHFDWHRIRKSCKSIYVLHSNTDRTVSFGNGKKLAKGLNTDLIKIPNGGHLNKSSGFGEFNDLLKIVITK